MTLSKVLVIFAVALVAIYVSNNVSFVKNIVG
jgi:hypothetical protein